MSKTFEDADSDKDFQEVGIPTVFTPVPSNEKSVILLQKQRSLPKCSQSSQPHDTSSIISILDISSVDHKVSSLKTKKKSIDNAEVIYVRMHFMQQLYTCFEIPTERTLAVVVRHLLQILGRQMRNRFTFYLYASPCDVIWERPQWEFMRKPAPATVFRHILKPDQLHLKLVDLSQKLGVDAVETLNFYMFVRNWQEEEKLSPNDGHWTFEHVLM